MSYIILYVEDEPAIIELVRDILEHKDINLISVSSGTEGIRKAREVRPDLMMLDVMMPDRSGWSIYNEVRSDPATKDTPIIMLTGQLHRYRIIKDFAGSKIDAYITKPFDVGSVRLQIEKMLGVSLWSHSRVANAEPERA